MVVTYSTAAAIWQRWYSFASICRALLCSSRRANQSSKALSSMRTGQQGRSGQFAVHVLNKRTLRGKSHSINMGINTISAACHPHLPRGCFHDCALGRSRGVDILCAPILLLLLRVVVWVQDLRTKIARKTRKRGVESHKIIQLGDRRVKSVGLECLHAVRRLAFATDKSGLPVCKTLTSFTHVPGIARPSSHACPIYS